MKISIIVPAYNEEQRIGRTIGEIKHFIQSRKLDWDILIVDDGSTDKTVEAAVGALKGEHRVRYKFIHNDRNRGKGYSVRQGMLSADGDLLLFTDADLSTPIQEIEKLIRAIDEGYDVAIGSRGLEDSQVEVHQNIVRETMGVIYNRIARLLTFKGIRDSQCGFKMFRRNVARELFELQRINGFSFDAEVVYLAQKRGFKIKELPVAWRNSPSSKVHILWDPIAMLWDLCRIYFIHLGHGRENRSDE